MFRIKLIAMAIVGISAFALTTTETGSDMLKLSEHETFSRVITESDPPCLQMYYHIERYAEEYDIPKRYAYGIAYKETHYRGPFDWDYKPGLVSSAGAVGPMQIMPQYAHPYVDGSFTRDELRTNVEMNVKASMRMLKKLKERYGDWKLVFGAYNTGRPMINQYALDVYNHNPNWK